MYLQGAGAAGPRQIGKDGKEKLGNDLRMFCEQVVDLALLHKYVHSTLLLLAPLMAVELMCRSEKINQDQLRAMYDALVDFVKVEWVEGSCEGDLPCKPDHLVFNRDFGGRLLTIHQSCAIN